ncbi:lysis protein [Klebsiella oxytoca]|uniref:lysis protein n=1 Tax=Klebsiella oxytoca TaxID=571 RepID=UPI003F53C7BE
MNRIAEITCAVVIVALSTMGWLANHYHGKYLQEQKRADTAEQSLKLANATITDMQVRQRDVAALDTKYTGELADAKETIERLHSDVIAGRKRLQLNARCTANGATATGGLGDASGPRLNDSAERDYFTLRERIVTITGQVSYLQEYIRTQCLK